jgi:hypothetical protein
MIKYVLGSILLLGSLALAQEPSPKPAAQTKPLASTVLSKETALELQLLAAQEKKATISIQELADMLIAPLREQQNSLVLAACKAAGFTEEEVQGRKCIVDIAGRTISRAPEEKKPESK